MAIYVHNYKMIIVLYCTAITVRTEAGGGGRERRVFLDGSHATLLWFMVTGRMQTADGGGGVYRRFLDGQNPRSAL